MRYTMPPGRVPGRRPLQRPASSTGVPRPPARDAHDLLLYLQRTVGNQAVCRMLASPGQARPARPAPDVPPVQGVMDPQIRTLLRTPAVPGSPQDEYQKQNFMAPQSSMLEVPQASQAPGPQAPGDTYDLEFSWYGKPAQFKGLNDEAVVKKLELFYFGVLDDLKQGLQMQRNWQEEFGSSMSSRWAAATASLVGGADWPDPSEWVDVEKEIFDAFLLLRESRWAIMAKRGEALDEGARAGAKPLDERRVQEIVSTLERGDRDADHCWDRWKQFLKDADKGASRTVTGLKVAKVAGAVAATYATGGLAAELELGFAGTTTLVAVGGGTYAAGQNLAQQGGEIMFGDRTSIDWGEVAKTGVVATAAGFVGGAIGGKLAGTLSNGLGRLVGGLSPEVMETAGITGAELLTNGERLFVQWAGNTLSSPFATATATVMQRAVDGKWQVTSVGDFFDQVLGEMVENGAINGFFGFVHANAGSTGAAGNEGGGGGGGGPGGGRTGGSPEAVPQHIGPEGDAYLSPEISTGVPIAIGPEYEPTPYAGGTSSGVPEHVGPEGDAYTVPGLSNGVPEAVNPTTDDLAAFPEGRNAGPVADQPAAADPQDTAAPSGSRVPVLRDDQVRVVSIDNTRMDSAGWQGSIAGAGGGVYRGRVETASGVHDVVIKLYGPHQRLYRNIEMEGALAAEATGYGPKVYGTVELPADPAAGTPERVGIAMGMQEGGMADAAGGGDAATTAANKAHAEQNAARVNERTLADLKGYEEKLLEGGHYYKGDLQGFIGPHGEYKPIDFGPIRPLPAKGTPQYDSAVADHRADFARERASLERMLEANRKSGRIK